MFISFLSQIASFFYISWLILLVARIISNFYIYYLIGKEELQESSAELRRQSPDNVLVYFTFWWSRSYMEGEAPQVIRLMHISNILHLVFIAHSVITAVIWVCLYGKDDIPVIKG
jgi:hypothetical protein